MVWSTYARCAWPLLLLVSTAGCNSMLLSGNDPNQYTANGPKLTIAEKFQRGTRSLIGMGPSEPIARAAYEAGEQLFQEKKYYEAEGKFGEAAIRWPDSPLEEDALFMKAESQFFTDRYYQASNTYSDLLRKHDNSRHLETVSARRFLIARYWDQVAKPDEFSLKPNFYDPKKPWVDVRGNSRSVYQSIRLSDPTGPLADDSVMAAAGSFFAEGRFQDADYYYDQLRKEYPRSEHQAKAHLLGVQAKLASYQGPKYENKTLEGASKLSKSALIQFPQELGEERKNLVEAQDQVYQEKARREYLMGEYYENTEHFKSAKFYYEAVVAEFPDTEYAVNARQKLEALKDSPDEGPERLGWLAVPFKPLDRK